MNKAAGGSTDTRQRMNSPETVETEYPEQYDGESMINEKSDSEDEPIKDRGERKDNSIKPPPESARQKVPRRELPSAQPDRHAPDRDKHPPVKEPNRGGAE